MLQLHPALLRLLAAFSLAGSVCVPPTAAADHPELRGRVVTGYQGWFTARGDGFGLNFNHWGVGGDFTHGKVTIDMWPDMSEYDEDEKYPTDFKHADGSTAHVFSSTNPKTVTRHLQWMADYGIGGAMLQRFSHAVRDPAIKAFRDQVFQNVRAASRETGTPWGLMYDLSGHKAGTIVEQLRADVAGLLEDGETDFRTDPNYLHHNGKPLVTVWGVGFSEGREYSLDECIELVDLLKNDPEIGGNAVMLGVPFWWHTQGRDSLDDPRLLELFSEVDVISPWSVGRMKSLEGIDGPIAQAWASDVETLKTLKEEHGAAPAYLPVISPGFSWHNLKKNTRGLDEPFDRTPRLRGQYLWQQAYRAIETGEAEMLYVAMFDEVDEATAIFKLDADPPTGETRFLPLEDGLQPDHYLWLTGEIQKMLRRERRATRQMPERDAAGSTR